MHSKCCLSKTFISKAIVLGIFLLVCQYLVNMILFNGNPSIILLKMMVDHSSDVVQENLQVNTTSKPKLLQPCPIISPFLKGRFKVNTEVASWTTTEEQNVMLSSGGRYKPTACTTRSRTAVIIPYRDREIHLKIFLQNIHPFLQRQQLDYGIFVVEPLPGILFNRALMMNIGFAEAIRSYDYQCFIFHDVDLLPEDDRNMYTCVQSPRHLSHAIDTFKYKLPYAQLFGGVSAISKKQFQRINGYSNLYFGWGGEDDDMYKRILYSNLTVTRYSRKVSRYKMLVHKKDTGNPERHLLLKTVRARRLTDGLNSLKYHVVKLELRPLYTWILVDVNMTDILDSEPIHHLAQGVNRKNASYKIQVSKSLLNITGAQHSLTQTQIASKLRIKPEVLSWIPKDFHGIVPTNLTKFEPLPDFSTDQLNKRHIEVFNGNTVVMNKSGNFTYNTVT